MRNLRPLTKVVKNVEDFYVFDVETGIRNTDGSIQWHLDGRPESFIFGVVYGKNYNKVIHSLKEFHEEFTLPRYNGKFIFAHNATYDLSTLYGSICKRFTDSLFNGSRFICCRENGLTFGDSSNVLGKIKLEKIGIMLGITKPELGDKGTLFSKNGVGAAEINRCMQDCVITYEALIEVFKFAGKIALTQASLSLIYFRKQHLSKAIFYDANVNHFFNSYFGGRTEAFKMGRVNAKVIDVNSMYPYIMKTIKFPDTKFLKLKNNPSLEETLEILKNYEGCIYATIIHSKSKYGYLPVKVNGKLLFPVGTFKGCWNFPEIRYALQMGVLKFVSIDSIVFGPGVPSPFETFIDKLYTDRLASKNEFEKYRLKIFMNSLYGKFAQRIDEETIYLENYEKSYDQIRDAQLKGTFKKLLFFNKDRNDAFLVLKSKHQRLCNYSIPSFASYITSEARVLLLKKMHDFEGKAKVVYCDTDSVFFEGINPEESTSKLGAWKLEDKTITEIRGLKNYSYIDNGVLHDSIKGIPKTATRTGENSFAYENLVQTKEALRRNLEPMTKIKRTKVLKGTYDKRNILTDGETSPLNLPLMAG